MSTTVVCYPVSDLGPNDGILVGAATAFGCLAQDPHDGDTTRIRYSANGQQNVCGVDWSAVPANADIISVVVRWAEAGTLVSSFAKGGLRHIPSGNNNYGTLQSLSPHIYASFDETFSVEPETGAAWTRALLDDCALAHMQGSLDSELQYPRLTALVAVITYDFLDPVHSEGSAESLAVRGAGSSIAGCTASAVSLAPSGAARALGTSASAEWLVPEAGGAR